MLSKSFKQHSLEDRAAYLRQRIAELSVPLPGALPYDNPRRLFVQKRYEGLTLAQFCVARHPHLGRAYWQAALDAQRISYQGRPANGTERVAPGALVLHTEPNTVEPQVDPRLDLIYEDAALLALHKPAPLPVHPCGRFNKNTVTHLLSLVWPELVPRPVHRLDANTTGVLILAKSKQAARHLSEQFCGQHVQKHYLVEVRGQPAEQLFHVDAGVTAQPGVAGSRSLAPPGSGLCACTTFSLLGATANGYTLLEARPHNGRTNQIRLHLAGLGLPIVGDRAYPARNPLRSEADALRTDPETSDRARCARGALGQGARTKEYSEYFETEQRSQRVPRVRMATGEVLGSVLTTTQPIHLHAWRLTIRSPASGELLDLEATPPPWARGLATATTTPPAYG